MEQNIMNMGLFGGEVRCKLQDFPYGAKTPSCHLPSSTPLNVSFNENSFGMLPWMEEREFLDLDCTGPFEDALLPENLNFGPDDLFKDLPLAAEVLKTVSEDWSSCFTHPSPSTKIISTPKNYSPIVYGNSLGAMGSPDVKTKKIIVSVRKVSIPNSKFNKCRQTDSSAFQFINSKENHSKDIINSLELLKPEITLGDAILSHDADTILKDLVGMVGPSKSCNNAEELFFIPESPTWSSNPVSPCSSIGSKTPEPFCSSQSGNNCNFASLLSPVSDVEDIKDIKTLSSDCTESSFDQEPDVSLLDDISESCSGTSNLSVKCSNSRKQPYIKDKRMRKMEQNKKAATRYRQKKKHEETDAQSTLTVEEDRRKELQEKYNNLRHELKFMKKIMREVFVAKGLIPAESFHKK